MGDKPEFATLTIGGNNAHFFPVVEACIYQYHPISYGPEYPDPKGLCAQAIADAQSEISKDTFSQQLRTLALSVLYNRILLTLRFSSLAMYTTSTSTQTPHDATINRLVPF